MKEKPASRSQQLLQLFQFLLVGIGLLNNIYQLFTGGFELVQIFLRSLYLVVYIFVILYTLWGYRKSVAPFQTALLALAASFCVLIDRARLLNPQPVFMILCALLAVIALLGFLCTFKKRKAAALIFGGASVAAALAVGIFIIRLTPEGGVAAFMAQQPFVCFFATVALYCTYFMRCIWSADGKSGTLLT